MSTSLLHPLRRAALALGAMLALTAFGCVVESEEPPVDDEIDTVEGDLGGDLEDSVDAPKIKGVVVGDEVQEPDPVPWVPNHDFGPPAEDDKNKDGDANMD